MRASPALTGQDAASPLRVSFLEGMARAAATVCVVTTDGPAGRHGITVSSLSSVSADGSAPTLLVCVHGASPAAAAIQANGVFCVNLLEEGAAHVSDVFAGRVPIDRSDRFAAVDWTHAPSGCPRLSGTHAMFDCRLATSTLMETHHVLFGAVQSVHLGHEGGAPLVYAGRGYRRLAPLAP
jgi:flavin reductase